MAMKNIYIFAAKIGWKIHKAKAKSGKRLKRAPSPRLRRSEGD